jgi:hypothetical protein
MASLTAAKFLLRLQSDGQPTYAGDPQVWERIEQMSDDLAGEEFETFLSEFKGAAILGLRLKGERRYLHLVRNRSDFRWCPTSISGDDPSPLDPEWMQTVPPLADDLTFKLIETLATLRSSLPGESIAQTFHTISETVALVALAKVHLAAWGNDKRAAALETIADMVSVQYLKDLGSGRSS